MRVSSRAICNLVHAPLPAMLHNDTTLGYLHHYAYLSHQALADILEESVPSTHAPTVYAWCQGAIEFHQNALAHDRLLSRPQPLHPVLLPYSPEILTFGDVPVTLNG
ncbi:hypothetical protein V565_030040 [Rhizoctonia solani 123E]|uniref:Uncharacterized protein n=1 Tax=Rhizoctonia solani 123E TaxID=1423351 RepID=A0A074S2M0_9AGAM|nr:hypothetical protein V565_030040 [Rhizoctonia solani 123E]